jgi:hypothetical protein
MKDLCEVSRRVLGDDDPRTHWREDCLKRFQDVQSRMRLPKANEELARDTEQLGHWLDDAQSKYEEHKNAPTGLSMSVEERTEIVSPCDWMCRSQ